VKGHERVFGDFGRRILKQEKSNCPGFPLLPSDAAAICWETTARGSGGEAVGRMRVGCVSRVDHPPRANGSTGKARSIIRSWKSGRDRSVSRPGSTRRKSGAR
jgi:hypothetical protein